MPTAHELGNPDRKDFRTGAGRSLSSPEFRLALVWQIPRVRDQILLPQKSPWMYFLTLPLGLSLGGRELRADDLRFAVQAISTCV